MFSIGVEREDGSVFPRVYLNRWRSSASDGFSAGRRVDRPFVEVERLAERMRVCLAEVAPEVRVWVSSTGGHRSIVARGPAGSRAAIERAFELVGVPLSS